MKGFFRNKVISFRKAVVIAAILRAIKPFSANNRIAKLNELALLIMKAILETANAKISIIV